MTKDKQLRDIKLAGVLEKRRLGQALNMKEFAVLAGVPYSVAREWFQLKGSPRFEGIVFWEDFAAWRNDRNGGRTTDKNPSQQTASLLLGTKRPIAFGLPPTCRADSSRIGPPDNRFRFSNRSTQHENSRCKIRLKENLKN